MGSFGPSSISWFERQCDTLPTSMSHDAAGPSLQARTQAFLREFFAKGEQLVRELIAENDRLRHAVSAGEGEAGATARTIERLYRQVAELEAECAELRRTAVGGRDSGTGFRNRLDDLEREHYRLAAMYVAGSQFHIATTVEDGGTFYVAETYHQNYAARNPHQPYVAAVAAPKVDKLLKYFPDRLKP